MFKTNQNYLDMKETIVKISAFLCVIVLSFFMARWVQRYMEVKRAESCLAEFRLKQQEQNAEWEKIKDIPLSDAEYLWAKEYAQYYAYKTADALCKKFNCTSPYEDKIEPQLKYMAVLEYDASPDEAVYEYADVLTGKTMYDTAVAVMERIVEVKKGK